MSELSTIGGEGDRSSLSFAGEDDGDSVSSRACGMLPEHSMKMDYYLVTSVLMLLLTYYLRS